MTTAAPLLAAAASPALAAADTQGGTGPSPQASPCCGGSGHFVTWQNQNTDDYLHVKGGSTGNSAEINTYTGSGTCADHGVTDLQCEEEWSQISTAYAHEFAYANVHSGKCLDDGENAITVPTQYSCGDIPDNMRWIYATFSVQNPQFTVYNALYTAYGTHARVLCDDSAGSTTLEVTNIVSPGMAIELLCDWE